MSKVFKALSDPTRRRVLQLLRRGPLSAGDLAAHFDVSKPTMSVHFNVLKDADLVHAEKHGKSIVYSLKMSVLEEALMGFAQTLGIQAHNIEAASNADLNPDQTQADNKESQS